MTSTIQPTSPVPTGYFQTNTIPIRPTSPIQPTTPNILYLLSLVLIVFLVGLIYYLITRTKKHVKHNSISKSLHKK